MCLVENAQKSSMRSFNEIVSRSDTGANSTSVSQLDDSIQLVNHSECPDFDAYKV